jgi:hypothetical protein
LSWGPGDIVEAWHPSKRALLEQQLRNSDPFATSFLVVETDAWPDVDAALELEASGFITYPFMEEDEITEEIEVLDEN